jgi:NO-binding membrane sensor protein with MHYT domain/nitrogen-specific signal transduction histidine kinase/ActR/RegA family two-component response regulator
VQLAGSYDYGLVALSMVIAALASYTALDLATRIRPSGAWSRHAWLGAAAIAMGGGIWSMHFIAMMAFGLPGMAVSYDWKLTLLSLLLPIAVTAFGFFVAIQHRTGWVGLVLSGLVMGLGIAAMHYTGMAAMQMAAGLSHKTGWVIASIAIAVGAATVALWLAFQRTSALQRILAAIAMGFAISGMHYTAMQGAVFTQMMAMDHSAAPLGGAGQTALAFWIAGTTIVILVLGLAAALFDRSIASHAEREAAALRQVFETSHLYQGLLTVEGGLIYANASALAGIRATLQEVVNRPFWETPWFSATPGAPQRIKAALRGAASGEARNETMTLELPIGSRSFEFSFRPVRDANGKVSAIVPEALDVTARLQAEQALRQAQKMEAMGNLTGGIAHDFNNLLMAVLGSLELLRKRLPADDSLLRLVDNAQEGARRGAALTQRLLAFARRQPLNPAAVDLPVLVRGMTDLLTRSIGPSLRIETRFPLKLPPALVDANQLELALLNLAVNARDAMPEGGVITIAARESDDGAAGHYVCLSLSDTGQGMDEATLARAQEPFFTTKSVGKGTGLGLSMVQGLAEQSNGKLLLKSRAGEGTVAEIWLPVAEAVQPATETPAAPAARPGRKGLAILLVDDDLLVLENASAMLADLGHQVMAAASAEEARDLLRSGKPVDLLITDQVMPGMTGLQLVQWAARERPGLPVLLATGFAELSADLQSDLVRLDKPFDQSQLAAAIAAGLSRDTRVVPLRRH